MRRVIDVSLPLSHAPAVPGDPTFARRLAMTLDRDGCEVGVLTQSAHAGAHIDFPAHFLAGGRRAGDYPASAFFLRAVVLDCGDALRLGPEVLAGADIRPGEAVLLRTRNSKERRFAGPTFPADFAAATLPWPGSSLPGKSPWSASTP